MAQETLMIVASLALCLGFATAVVPQEDTSPVAEEQVVDLSSLMPEGTLIYMEGPGLAEFISQGLSHPLVERLLASPFGKELVAELEASPEDLVAFVESLYGMPLFETAGSLVEGGAALGLHPRKGGEPGLTLAARSHDDLAWAESLHKLLSLAADSGDLPRRLVDPKPGLGGADTWSFGSDFAMAQRGGTFVASNDAKRYDEILGLLADTPASALADARHFQRAREARHEQALLWGWIDLAQGVALSEGKGPFANFHSMPAEPAVQMLLGGGFALLGRAEEISSELTLDEQALGLSFMGYGVDAGATRQLLPGEGQASLVMPTRTEREVGRLVAYRDLGGVFKHRAELFPPEILPAFSRSASELAPILGGLDLGEDILPGLSPWLRIVVREVDFDPKATPELTLPAIALMVDLEQPEELAELLTSSFQTAIGLVNIERAQQGYKPMLLFLQQHGGITYSAARFLAPGAEDGVDLAYNLVPACAIVGNTFLIGSHLDLVREVAEQLRDGDTEGVAADADRLELNSDALQRLVSANAEALAMNAVLEEGKSLEEARADIEVMNSLLGLFERAELKTQYTADGEVEVELRLEFPEVKQ